MPIDVHGIDEFPNALAWIKQLIPFVFLPSQPALVHLGMHFRLPLKHQRLVSSINVVLRSERVHSHTLSWTGDELLLDAQSGVQRTLER